MFYVYIYIFWQQPVTHRLILRLKDAFFFLIGQDANGFFNHFKHSSFDKRWSRISRQLGDYWARIFLVVLAAPVTKLSWKQNTELLCKNRRAVFFAENKMWVIRHPRRHRLGRSSKKLLFPLGWKGSEKENEDRPSSPACYLETSVSFSAANSLRPHSPLSDIWK